MEHHIYWYLHGSALMEAMLDIVFSNILLLPLEFFTFPYSGCIQTLERKGPQIGLTLTHNPLSRLL